MDLPSAALSNNIPIHYDDLKYDYRKFWQYRHYEHESEVIAINRLLANSHFHLGIDIGGGYGRLTPLLKNYCDEVALVEPSKQQISYAKENLGDLKINYVLGHANSLKFDDDTVGIAIMVRVSHHLENPASEFSEIYRVLEKGGLAVIEVANFSHFRNRIKYILKGKKLPNGPTPIGQFSNSGKHAVPFYNHNPHTIRKQLEGCGLKVVKTLSVSNLRSQHLKKF